MAEKAHLLKVKATLKKRQPKFIRQDAHKHKRVKQVWRAPKGLHSKMKDSKKGYRAKLQGGYQTPKAVRGLDKHGLKPTIVATVKQLESLDPKVHSLILAGGLGGRIKLAILEKAGKFTILNAKPDAAETIKSKLKKQHSEKKEREKTRDQKHKQLEEKAAKADKKEEPAPAAEEKKEQEEQEKQKVLHKKE
jgi:large subunit ribosomal protein L32e